MKYKRYSKNELLDTIGLISIEMAGSCVVTKFNGRAINTTPVSGKYEIFDIVKYIREKIGAIEKNFEISKYCLRLHRGLQYLELLSDSVEIDGHVFTKSFHILNSTDKSRKLSFRTGLFCESGKYYVIGVACGTSLNKRHTKGVTDAAELASAALDGETFAEQARAIGSLSGHKILISNVRKTILGENPTMADHQKFDSFRSGIRDTTKLTPAQRNVLFKRSSFLSGISQEEDFYLDAMQVLQIYLRIFAESDSHTISRETEKIMKMTQWSIRNNLLESLGI